MSWAVHVAGCSWCGTAAQHIKGFLAKKISNTYKIIIIIIIIIGKKKQNGRLIAWCDIHSSQWCDGKGAAVCGCQMFLFTLETCRIDGAEQGQWFKKCLCEVTFMGEDCYACVFKTLSLPARRCLDLTRGGRYLNCLDLPINWWETELTVRAGRRNYYYWDTNKWTHCFSCVISTSKRPAAD